MGSFSIWHWLVVLVIVALVFGTKKLRNMGEDLGSAVKGFKKGISDAEDDLPPKPAHTKDLDLDAKTVDVTAKEKQDSTNSNT